MILREARAPPDIYINRSLSDIWINASIDELKGADKGWAVRGLKFDLEKTLTWRIYLRVKCTWEKTDSMTDHQAHTVTVDLQQL